uniref:Lipid_DES domain-containing protein n=1 Tax=Heterorhabditis bacteriophora TaxID=37862 RepID=A0A1I7XTK4_HETBA
MGQSVSRDDFIWTYTEQPHLSRREAILKAHPEIKKLFGIDYSFKYVVVAMVIFQIFMCWLLQDADWVLILLEGYLCGGVINHAMTLAIHDISHNTVFGNKYPIAVLILQHVLRLNKIIENIEFSYYGTWNLCTFNVGYHVEHHDFPYIPGRNLPMVRKIAPEFYDDLMIHMSWSQVLWDFVFKPSMGPYARIKRKPRVEQAFWGNYVLAEYIIGFLHYTGYYEMKRYAESVLDLNNNKKKI